jgi:hypothetical protein
LQAIKTERRQQQAADKLKEREKNLKYFDDFLRIVADKKAAKDRLTQQFNNFWAEQVPIFLNLRFGRKVIRNFFVQE